MPGGLLSALGIVRLKNYLASLGRYVVGQAVLLAGLLLMIVLALGFGVTALTIWLAEQWGPAIAFGVVAGGFLVLALILEVIMVVRRMGRADAARKQPAAAFGAGMPPDQMAFGSVAAMAVLGYILGRQIMRR